MTEVGAPSSKESIDGAYHCVDGKVQPGAGGQFPYSVSGACHGLFGGPSRQEPHARTPTSGDPAVMEPQEVEAVRLSHES